MTGVSSPLDRFRQPEYTGENRCIPCTTVNAAIALVVSAAVATLNPLVGTAVLVVCGLAIYLRGYLVPGTPTLTKRYVPDWLLARFDKADLEPDDVDVPEEPEAVLLENAVVRPCVDVDDLCLETEVRAEWRARMDDLREGDRAHQLAAFFDVKAETVDLTVDDHVTARVDGRRVGRWESDAAMLADLAAHHVLSARVAAWESIPPRRQGMVAAGMRAFAESCPACEGPISITEDTVDSCCRSYDVRAITCEECSATVLEVTQ